jgi:hypothetical protein
LRSLIQPRIVYGLAYIEWSAQESAIAAALSGDAMLCGRMRMVFGWNWFVFPDPSPCALLNFPMQANAAEMMRIAACLATEAGLRVCMPIHDAFLIESPLEQLEADVRLMQALMAKASRIVLARFELRTKPALIRYPEHYSDPRGERMWAELKPLL